MAQNTVGWPKFGGTDSYTKLRFAEPLQSEGNLSYLEFISTVKSLWEQSFPNFPIKSSSPRGEHTLPPLQEYADPRQLVHSGHRISGYHGSKSV